MDAPRPVADEDVLWRRVPPNHHRVGQDVLRVNCGTLSDHPEDGYMSVNIARETTVERVMHGYEGFALIAIRARVLRDLGLTIMVMPEDGNPGHAGVFGDKPKSCCKAMIRSARSVVPADLACEVR